MLEGSSKGPLIQKKPKSNTLERPQPVKVKSQNDFKFTKDKVVNDVSPIESTPETKQLEIASPEQPTLETTKISTKMTKLKTKSVVGKNNNVKSIKVPQDLHIKIGVLGKFMDQNKTYAIIDELVKYYSENELTDRQKKQFEYMTEFFHED